ncbi:MAG: hypothetical protein WB919_06095 [Candidatus Sulfotelmatobacter sp.]
MLGKCANPMCRALFRKLGSGKLFAFESVTADKSPSIIPETSNAQMGRSPVFFWLCETCSLIFTLGLDADGRLTLQTFPDGGTIFGGHALNQPG